MMFAQALKAPRFKMPNLNFARRAVKNISDKAMDCLQNPEPVVKAIKKAAMPLASKMAAATLAKGAVASVFASAAAPAVIPTLACAFAGAAAAGTAGYLWEWRKSYLKGEERPKLFEKKRVMTAGAGGLIGSIFGLTFGEETREVLKPVFSSVGKFFSSAFGIASASAEEMTLASSLGVPTNPVPLEPEMPSYFLDVPEPEPNPEPEIAPEPEEAFDDIPMESVMPSALDQVQAYVENNNVPDALRGDLAELAKGKIEYSDDVAYSLNRLGAYDLAAKILKEAALAGDAEALEDIKTLSAIPKFASFYEDFDTDSVVTSQEPEKIAAASVVEENNCEAWMSTVTFERTPDPDIIRIKPSFQISCETNGMIQPGEMINVHFNGEVSKVTVEGREALANKLTVGMLRGWQPRIPVEHIEAYASYARPDAQPVFALNN